MNIFLKANDDKVFEITYYESYNEQEASKLANSITSEALYNRTEIHGEQQIQNIKILQSSYDNEAVVLSRTTIIKLLKKVEEIESVKCTTTLLDYFS